VKKGGEGKVRKTKSLNKKIGEVGEEVPRRKWKNGPGEAFFSCSLQPTITFPGLPEDFLVFEGGRV